MRWKEFVVVLSIVIAIFIGVGVKAGLGHPDLIQYIDWYMSTSVTEDREVIVEALTFSQDGSSSFGFRRYMKTGEFVSFFHSKYEPAKDTIQAVFVGNNAYTLYLIRPDMIEAFKDGRSTTIHYFDVNSTKRAVKFSLVGFTRSYWWLTK